MKLNMNDDRLNKKISRIVGIIQGHYKENLAKLKLAVVYGSVDRDIDLLLVRDTEHREAIANFTFSAQDLLVDGIEISGRELSKRIDLFDIGYTEPILTGKAILGDKKWFMQLRKALYSMEPTSSTRMYLHKQGLIALLNAISCLNVHKHARDQETLDDETSIETIHGFIDGSIDIPFHSRYLELCLLNLSFACSYIAACKLYEHELRVVTLDELLQRPNNSLLRKICHYKRKVARQKKLLTIGEINCVICEVKEQVFNYGRNVYIRR